MQKLVNLSVVLGVLFLAAFLFWLGFLNHVGVNDVGLQYDSLTGVRSLQRQSGWYLTSPTTLVAHYTTEPMTVTIQSNAKVINSRIVRFNPDGWEEFITLQGWSYMSESELRNILLGYAFSGESYPFLEILQKGGVETVPAKKQ